MIVALSCVPAKYTVDEGANPLPTIPTVVSDAPKSVDVGVVVETVGVEAMSEIWVSCKAFFML